MELLADLAEKTCEQRRREIGRRLNGNDSPLPFTAAATTGVAIPHCAVDNWLEDQVAK